MLFQSNNNMLVRIIWNYIILLQTAQHNTAPAQLRVIMATNNGVSVLSPYYAPVAARRGQHGAGLVAKTTSHRPLLVPSLRDNHTGYPHKT